MKLTVGKFYKDDIGRKVGPVEACPTMKDWCWTPQNNECHYWDGSSVNGNEPDIIDEWKELGSDADTEGYAAEAAEHGICIRVIVGEVVMEYDGREVK